MTTPAVEFESVGDQLHLIYRPRDDTAWVYHKFQRGEALVIKGTFHLTRDNLVVDGGAQINEGNTSELDPEGLGAADEMSMSFVVAMSDGEYFCFDPNVLPIGVPVLAGTS